MRYLESTLAAAAEIEALEAIDRLTARERQVAADMLPPGALTIQQTAARHNITPQAVEAIRVEVERLLNIQLVPPTVATATPKPLPPPPMPEPAEPEIAEAMRWMASSESTDEVR